MQCSEIFIYNGVMKISSMLDRNCDFTNTFSLEYLYCLQYRFAYILAMGNKHGCCVYPGGRSSSRSSNQKVLGSPLDPHLYTLQYTTEFETSEHYLTGQQKIDVFIFPVNIDTLRQVEKSQIGFPFLNVSIEDSDSETSQNFFSNTVPRSSKPNCHNSESTFNPSVFPHNQNYISSSIMSDNSSHDLHISYQHSLPSYRVHTTYFPCSSSFSDASYPYNPTHQGNNSSWCDASCLSLPTPKNHHVSHGKTHSEPVCGPPYCQMTSFLPSVPSNQGSSASGHEYRGKDDKHAEEAVSNLQHISEREPDDLDQDPIVINK
ncbi:hypothetical protein Avbf_03133 [Armadillidium vulgare]|nr:hypothetical protein Avbf_03133 [Armadillidium vulgare]